MRTGITGYRTHLWPLFRHPLRGFGGFAHRYPRVRGLTRGFIPSPPSGVGVFAHRYPRVRGLIRGFIPSPPSGVRGVRSSLSTGSRTHPWLYSVAPFGGSGRSLIAIHGFADSYVALFRRPFRG